MLGGSHRADGDSEALGTNGFAIFGAAAGDKLGGAVAVIGDVNGDGFDDLAISAPSASPGGRATAGQVHIVFGRAEGFDDVYLGEGNLARQGIAVIQGATATNRLGESLASAGDVDGDGLADLLIGGYYGSAFVVLGKELKGLSAAPKVEGAQAARVGADVDIEGTAARGEFLQGSLAANTISAIGSGDVAYGGAGDDTLAIDAVDFKRAYGGSGIDTLRLDGAGMWLDLTDHGRAWLGFPASSASI